VCEGDEGEGLDVDEELEHESLLRRRFRWDDDDDDLVDLRSLRCIGLRCEDNWMDGWENRGWKRGDGMFARKSVTFLFLFLPSLTLTITTSLYILYADA